MTIKRGIVNMMIYIHTQLKKSGKDLDNMIPEARCDSMMPEARRDWV